MFLLHFVASFLTFKETPALNMSRCGPYKSRFAKEYLKISQFEIGILAGFTGGLVDRSQMIASPKTSQDHLPEDSGDQADRLSEVRVG